MLVSINPYRALPLYTARISTAYQRADPQLIGTVLPPHVFGVASRAYSGLREERRDQCVLITGESREPSPIAHDSSTGNILLVLSPTVRHFFAVLCRTVQSQGNFAHLLLKTLFLSTAPQC